MSQLLLPLLLINRFANFLQCCCRCRWRLVRWRHVVLRTSSLVMVRRSDVAANRSRRNEPMKPVKRNGRVTSRATSTNSAFLFRLDAMTWFCRRRYSCHVICTGITRARACSEMAENEPARRSRALIWRVSVIERTLSFLEVLQQDARSYKPKNAHMRE